MGENEVWLVVKDPHGTDDRIPDELHSAKCVAVKARGAGSLLEWKSREMKLKRWPGCNEGDQSPNENVSFVHSCEVVTLGEEKGGKIRPRTVLTSHAPKKK